MLTDDDFENVSNGSRLRTFFNRIHERTGAGGDISAEDPNANATGTQAGLQYLQTNPSEFNGLNADRAADYAADISAGQRAIGAPSGSIAARSNPFQYGTIASREFGKTFTPGALDSTNNAIDHAVPDARQGLRQRLTATYSSGFRNTVLEGNQDGGSGG